MPHTNLTISSDASWQDCPDTGHSTIRYMIFHNGILIKANSTMSTPIAVSYSEAKYMTACSTSMANPDRICILVLYNMTHLGTKQWHESTQLHQTSPSFLIKDTEAIIQIAQNGNLTRKTLTSNNISTMFVKTNKMVYINYTGTLYITTC
jgi:hypothetical protein